LLQQFPRYTEENHDTWTAIRAGFFPDIFGALYDYNKFLGGGEKDPSSGESDNLKHLHNGALGQTDTDGKQGITSLTWSFVTAFIKHSRIPN